MSPGNDRRGTQRAARSPSLCPKYVASAGRASRRGPRQARLFYTRRAALPGLAAGCGVINHATLTVRSVLLHAPAGGCRGSPARGAGQGGGAPRQPRLRDRLSGRCSPQSRAATCASSTGPALPLTGAGPVPGVAADASARSAGKLVPACRARAVCGVSSPRRGCRALSRPEP